jgi:hypothetical protein
VPLLCRFYSSHSALIVCVDIFPYIL